MPDLTGGPTAGDLAMLDDIRDLFELIDPVPESVVNAARECFTWRTIDAELAELIDDSVLTPSAIRGHGDTRLLTFEASEVTIVVEVTELDGLRKLIGQVVPAGPRRLEVRHRDGVVSADVDEMGRFTAVTVPAGPVSIACACQENSSVVTSWVPV
jgi:hypothetical protein